MTRQVHGYRLVPWAQAQHAQGLCESWVNSKATTADGWPCRNRANSEVYAPVSAPGLMLHLCRVHAIPYIGAINRQRAGDTNVILRERHVPLPLGMKWRPI